MHFFVTLRRAIYPLLIASQTVPIPMLAPVLVLWLGFGLLPKLVVMALVSFFSIVVTTLAAFAAVDPDLIKLMRTFDASRWRTFWDVELPSALPGVFTGAKIAVIVAVIGAVFAEQSGANAGLGYLFEQSIPQLLTARAYATVVILSAVRDRAVRPAHPGRAAGAAVGPPTDRRHHPMKRQLPFLLTALAAALRARRAVRRRTRSLPAQRLPSRSRDARLVSQRRPRRPLPGAGRG